LSDPNIWNPIANPSSTTTYTVIGTIAGCSNSASLTIIVNPVPTAVVSNDTTVCAGSSITLSASGGNTYLWNTGQTSVSINVNPSSTTTYFVTATIANCSDTGSVVITVNPLPTITVTASADTICEGDSTQLDANGGVSYLWTPGNLTGASISVSPLSTTSYTVVATDANGCTGTAIVAITVNQMSIVSVFSSADSACVVGMNISLTGIPSGGIFSGTGVLGNLFNPSLAGVGVDTVTYTYTSNGCAGSAIKTVEVFVEPIIDSIIHNGSMFIVNFDLIINYKVKMTVIDSDGSQEYLPKHQSNLQAIFEDVTINNGDLILIEPVSPTLSGCFVYQTYVGIAKTKGKDFIIKLFPNPFSDILNVELPKGNYEIILTDMVGQNVQTVSAEGNFTLQRNDLKAGLYLLQIISKGKILSVGRVMIKD